MTQLVLLGTGTPNACPENSGPATAVVVDGKAYIFDFGPGVVRQCSKAYFKGIHALHLLGLDSDTFYIYHVAAVMVDNLRRLLLGINLSDKAIMDFDFPGVGFPV